MAVMMMMYLMNDIQKDALECELNGDEYKEPKKRNNDLCNDCNKETLIDYQNSHLYELWFM